MIFISAQVDRNHGLKMIGIKVIFKIFDYQQLGHCETMCACTGKKKPMKKIHNFSSFKKNWLLELFGCYCPTTYFFIYHINTVTISYN